MAESAARKNTEALESKARTDVRMEKGHATTALDPLIHQRTRLAIVSALAANETLSFNELKRLTKATDGNLSVHARKLEEAGYLECRKSFQDRTPRTDYALSPAGRDALERYIRHMEALLEVTKKGV